MRWSWALTALSASLLCYPVHQIEPPKAVLKTITLRILNGRSGKPVRNEFPNIWVAAATFHLVPAPRTDSKGEVVVDITEAQPYEIRVSPNYYVDCRFKGDQIIGADIKYSLGDVISTGVVADNLCGTSHVLPTPGVLVLYVRPRTLKELWEL